MPLTSLNPRAALASVAIVFCLGAPPAGAGELLRVPAEFPTIQQAVDAAAPGDKIRVTRGTYDENVTIIGKSNLGLLGSHAVLSGAGAGIGIHVLGSDGVRIQGFVVEGFEAGIVLEGTTHSRIHRVEMRRNDSDEPTLRDGLQLIDSHFNWITNVNAHDNGHNGITLKAGSTHNRIHASASDDNGQNAAVAANFGGCGIQLIGSENDENVITTNETHRNGWGIQVGGGSDGNRISQNRSHANSRAGIVVLDPGSGNVVRQNKAAGNGLADVAPSGTFDLFDQGPLDNDWRNNQGTFNF